MFKIQDKDQKQVKPTQLLGSASFFVENLLTTLSQLAFLLNTIFQF